MIYMFLMVSRYVFNQKFGTIATNRVYFKYRMVFYMVFYLDGFLNFLIVIDKNGKINLNNFYFIFEIFVY